MIKPSATAEGFCVDAISTEKKKKRRTRGSCASYREGRKTRPDICVMVNTTKELYETNVSYDSSIANLKMPSTSDLWITFTKVSGKGLTGRLLVWILSTEP